MRASDLPRLRALTIAALGPAVFLLGLVWTVLRLALADPGFSFRAIIFAPSHQMMAVGAIIAAICVPVAMAVSRATEEDLRLPGLQAKQEQPEPRAEERPRRRRSYQSYN